jgi:hypothetical protein
MSKQLTAQPTSYPAELRDILERGQTGDAAALPELTKAFDENPDLADRLGDMPRLALEALLAAVAGRSLTVKEAIRRRADRLCGDLAGSNASLLERLVAERIALCWVECHHADTELASALKKSSAESPLMESAERRVNAAQARYLESIEALATVKRLTQPASSWIDPWKPVAQASHWGAIPARPGNELAGSST